MVKVSLRLTRREARVLGDAVHFVLNRYNFPYLKDDVISSLDDLLEDIGLFLIEKGRKSLSLTFMKRETARPVLSVLEASKGKLAGTLTKRLRRKGVR